MDHISAPIHADPAHAFVVELLRTGLMLTDLMADLLASVPAGAFPGEDSGDVLVGMLAGSIRPAVLAAGPTTVMAASALLGAGGDRVVDDLEAAAEVARRREPRARRRGPRRP